jgi:hypothetical protein
MRAQGHILGLSNGITLRSIQSRRPIPPNVSQKIYWKEFLISVKKISCYLRICLYIVGIVTFCYNTKQLHKLYPLIQIYPRCLFFAEIHKREEPIGTTPKVPYLILSNAKFL